MLFLVVVLSAAAGLAIAVPDHSSFSPASFETSVNVL